MKKIILTLVMVVALAFGITACDTSSKNSGTVFDGIKTSEDFYAYSAASVGSLISSMNAGTSATSQRSLSMGIQSRDFRDDDDDDDDWNGGNHGENSGLPSMNIWHLWKAFSMTIPYLIKKKHPTVRDMIRKPQYLSKICTAE